MKQKPSQILAQPKEIATHNQVAILMGIVDGLSHILRAPAFDPAGNPVDQKLDGGVKCSLEGTLIKTLTQLDFIVDERGRWNVSEQLKTEKAAREAVQANRNFLRAQTAAVAHIVRPCVRHQPSLVKITDGTYAAILGDMEDMANCIIGQGRSPEEALKAFDKIFSGRVPEHVRKWAGTPTQPENEKKPNEQPNKLDPRISQPPAGTPPGGKVSDSDSRKLVRRRLYGPKQTRTNRNPRKAGGGTDPGAGSPN
jgi:hypothetical protein